MNKKGMILIISGPSGVGKGTLLNNLVKNSKGDISYSISATTRECREGEAEGVTYYYKTEEEFDRLIESGDVLEYDTYSNHRYGTLKSVLRKALDEGKSIALDITVPGAVAVKSAFKDEAVSVFIMPPSIEELEKRLIERGREDINEIYRRIAFAIESEMSKFNEFDYVVTNDVLEGAVGRLEHILESEFNKSSRNSDILENMNVDSYLRKYKSEGV